MMGRTRKPCRGFVTLLLVHFDIDPPFHLSSFSYSPSSNLYLSLFLSWIQEWRSLLALTERGWRCLFIWRVLEPWLRRGGSSEADATSASLVHGPPAGFWPTHQENKKWRRMKKLVVKFDSLGKGQKFTFLPFRCLFHSQSHSLFSLLS